MRLEHFPSATIAMAFRCRDVTMLIERKQGVLVGAWFDHQVGPLNLPVAGGAISVLPIGGRAGDPRVNAQERRRRSSICTVGDRSSSRASRQAASACSVTIATSIRRRRG